MTPTLPQARPPLQQADLYNLTEVVLRLRQGVRIRHPSDDYRQRVGAGFVPPETERSTGLLSVKDVTLPVKGDSRVKVSGNSHFFVEMLVAVAKSSPGELTTVIPRPCSLKLRTVVTALALAALAISASVPVAAKKICAFESPVSRSTEPHWRN